MKKRGAAKSLCDRPRTGPLETDFLPQNSRNYFFVRGTAVLRGPQSDEDEGLKRKIEKHFAKFPGGGVAGLNGDRND